MKIVECDLLLPTKSKRVHGKARKILYKALSKLPDSVAKFCFDNRIGFFSPPPETDAFVFNQRDLRKNESLICIYPEVWAYKEEEIIKIMLHEITHHYLKHKTFSTFNQSYKKEKEADLLTEEWFNGK